MKKLRAFGTANAKGLIALFFAAVLAFGLLTMSGYGHAWDDLGEMNILRMALKEYDEIIPMPYGDALDEMGIGPISLSEERDHGICLYYPLLPLLCDPNASLAQIRPIWRGWTWAIFTFGLYALYAVLRRLGLPRPFAVIGVLMMLASPHFFAEGHYNNKDIPLLATVLVLFWQGIRLAEKPVPIRAACFAVAAGFCVGTKIIGAAYAGLIGLMVAISLAKAGRLNRRTAGIGLLTLLLSLACYALLTPALLRDPGAFVEYLLRNSVGFTRWHGSVLLGGNVIDCSQMKPPRYYLPVMIAVTTPLWALGLIVASLCLCRRRDGHELLRMTVLLGWVLPLAALVIIRPLVYNGWRHVYFLYGPMVIGMADAMYALWQRKRPLRIAALAAAAGMAVSAVGIAVNHPFQYAYYNPLVPTENRAELFEMDWWNLSCENALRELMAKTDGPVTVKPSDSRTWSGMAMASCYPGMENLRPVREGDAQYLIANLSYAKLAGCTPDASLTPVVTVSAYGAPITVIYAVEGGLMP